MGSGVTPVMRISEQKGPACGKKCAIQVNKDGRNSGAEKSVGIVQTKGVANVGGNTHRG